MSLAVSHQMQSSLPNVRGRYQFDVPLSKHTWFGVGGNADVVFKPNDVDDLAHFLREKSEDLSVYVMGVGSNLLVRDGGIRGCVIRLTKPFCDVVVDGCDLIVGAGVLDRNVALTAAGEGIAGLEFLVGIPGTIGGALRMNAGAYGSEIKDVFVSAQAVDGAGNIHHLDAEMMGFSYRHCDIPSDWIFTSARLRGTSSDPQKVMEMMSDFLKRREETQPIRAKTGGSTFANPQDHSAWRLIDEVGYRGKVRGDAMISEKHCNFLINQDQATAYDLEMLAEEARALVLQKTGIDLRWEIQRIGDY